MQDEIFQKGQTEGRTKNTIPYYQKNLELNCWVVSQVTHSAQYRMKRTVIMAGSEPKVQLRKTIRESNRGGIADTTMEYLIWLSETYGSTIWEHPRTNEKLDFVSETRRETVSEYSSLRLRLYDNKHYNGLPRVKYHRQLNRPRSVKLIVNIESGEIFVKPESVFLGKPTKQWKGIWNLSKRSVPRKFNFTGNGKYNWGDQPIIRQQEITERCNFLCKQIRQRSEQQ